MHIDTSLKIKFKLLDKTMKAPTRGSSYAAGWDLHAAEDIELRPYRAQLIRTGVAVSLPPNTALLIMSRSGFSVKNQVITPNGVGLIDEDYRGELRLNGLWIPPMNETLEVVHFITTSVSTKGVFKIKKYDRIAQCILVPYYDQMWEEVDELPETKRGHGGFGSTGI
jgi:dUTP pyrophosphatase